MFLLVSGSHISAPQRDTTMASPYKVLWIWVTHFPEYLAYEISHRPDSCQCFLFIYILSFSRFWTFYIEWFAFLFSMAWRWKQRIVCNITQWMLSHVTWKSSKLFQQHLTNIKNQNNVLKTFFSFKESYFCFQLCVFFFFMFCPY